jgi:hypothetical protein
MSEVKVNKISPRSGTDVTLGDSGDTFTIPSGATINNQGTAVNFGATGSASWVTTVKTSSPFTAVAGEGYFVDTTSGAISVNLPAGTPGAVVAFKDYAGTFDTNALTLVQNGSDKIGGSTDNKQLVTEGIAATLIFIDSTQGWLVTDDGLQNTAATLPYSLEFLVVGGGGGGGGNEGGDAAGGGGAGGFRTSTQTVSAGRAITVTVGDGGAGGARIGSVAGTNGVDSSISGSGITTITSAGGGGGGRGVGGSSNGLAGGSGGGAGYAGTGGTGNTPSTSPSQGNNGGNSNLSNGGTGGGGSGAVGVAGSGSNAGTAGGAGSTSSITGSSVTYAGGGGGGSYIGAGGAGGTGGGGTGGDGSSSSSTAGTVNLGGGGGGGGNTSAGAAGGKGVVILSMPDAAYSGTTTGAPTVATGVSGKTVLTFTGSGSYTT